MRQRARRQLQQHAQRLRRQRRRRLQRRSTTSATAASPQRRRPRRSSQARRRGPDRRPSPTATDGDGNGFVDDIAGWDFFDNDNDPYDASSYFAACGPRLRAAPRRGRARQRRPGRDRRLPALPDPADPHLGHVRLRRQHLRHGDPLRDRQRGERDRGRQRQPLPLGLRRGRLQLRLRPRRRPDLLRRRPQHRQPQLPGQLRPRDADPGHRPRHRRPRHGRRRQSRRPLSLQTCLLPALGVCLGHERCRRRPSSAGPTRPSTAARARSRWRGRPARRTPARPPARRRW